jgi:serine/threonine protein kinase
MGLHDEDLVAICNSAYLVSKNKRLGSGVTSSVYIGCDVTHNNCNYAVKVFDFTPYQEHTDSTDFRTWIYIDKSKKVGVIRNYIREVKALRILRKQNFKHMPMFYGSFLCNDTWTGYIVAEKVDGTLYDYLRKLPLLSAELYTDICRQLVNAVLALHDCGIRHNDLHIDNVLVKSNGSKVSIYINDFDHATELHSIIQRLFKHFPLNESTLDFDKPQPLHKLMVNKNVAKFPQLVDKLRANEMSHELVWGYQSPLLGLFKIYSSQKSSTTIEDTLPVVLYSKEFEVEDRMIKTAMEMICKSEGIDMRDRGSDKYQEALEKSRTLVKQRMQIKLYTDPIKEVAAFVYKIEKH